MCILRKYNNGSECRLVLQYDALLVMSSTVSEHKLQTWASGIVMRMHSLNYLVMRGQAELHSRLEACSSVPARLWV